MLMDFVTTATAADDAGRRPRRTATTTSAATTSCSRRAATSSACTPWSTARPRRPRSALLGRRRRQHDEAAAARQRRLESHPLGHARVPRDARRRGRRLRRARAHGASADAAGRAVRRARLCARRARRARRRRARGRDALPRARRRAGAGATFRGFVSVQNRGYCAPSNSTSTARTSLGTSPRSISLTPTANPPTPLSRARRRARSSPTDRQSVGSALDDDHADLDDAPRTRRASSHL